MGLSPIKLGSLQFGVHPSPPGLGGCDPSRVRVTSLQVWGCIPPGLREPPLARPPHPFTCSPRGSLGSLQTEHGEQRQETPQEVSGQRCGEREGDGGSVRAGPAPNNPRRRRPASYPRRRAPGPPCCGSRPPRSAPAGCAAPPPTSRPSAPPSWEGRATPPCFHRHCGGLGRKIGRPS